MRFKGYKLTFKINASHRTAENGSAHSHTFEFTVYISKRDGFAPFGKMEAIAGEAVKKYSGVCLNDTPPFDEIKPTVENLARQFFAEIAKSCAENGYELCRIDACESANRVFTIKNMDISAKKKDMILNAAEIMEFSAESSEKTAEAEYSKDAGSSEPAVKAEEKAETKPKALVNESAGPASFRYFWFSLALLIFGGFVIMKCVEASGYYPLGLDIHGHLFKSDLMYSSLKQGNLYPLFTEYWYNGLQPYRYWPPMPYYFMALLQFIAGGSVIKAYLGFIWASFVIGGTGWLLFGRKLGRPVLGLFMAFIWFFLPDNLRVFFGEGNLPRMFITMLIPLIFYCIWQFTAYNRRRMIFPLIALMITAVLGHLMISAMIGVGTFVFMLIYAAANRSWARPVQCILAMLFSFAAAGIWVYPSLVGGITSMDSGGNSELMASLAAKLTVSLNPFLRLDGKVTELYFGLSIAVIAVMGLILSNRRAMPGFASILIVIAGTTTALTPLIQKIPFSQLFWIRRFAPIGYALFVIGLLEWRRLKKPLLAAMCLLIALDCIPSLNLKEYDHKMNIPAIQENMAQSMNEYLFQQAKEITKQRVSLMDLSTFGPMPSYAFGTLENKTPYVFGWAWQGAATADNIVRINEALENESYDFIFDRSIELGADTVIFSKSYIRDFSALELSASRLGYKPAGESDKSIMYSLYADGNFGVVTDYGGLAVGTTSAIVPQLFPYFGTGDYAYIDDYSFEELACYEKLYLSGFFYRDKNAAEELVNSLAESGVDIYIDMSNIPSDPLTTRMTFMGVSAQPITFNKSYPDLYAENRRIESGDFTEEYSQWNTVYLNDLDRSLGYSWFENEKLDFIGKKGNENITFIGFNLLYHAITSDDSEVYGFLNSIMNLESGGLPVRKRVDIDITYEGNRIIIDSPEDGVNTTIAYQDTFTSDQEIGNVNNLLEVNKGTTVIEMKYPYLSRGITVSIFGIGAEILLIFMIFRKRKAKDYTRQPGS